MHNISVRLLILTLLSLFLCACQPASGPELALEVTSVPQVTIQGDNTGKEELQTIELDNCDGKNDAVRTEQRLQSIEVTISAETAAKLGASAEVIIAEVQATVGAAITGVGQRSTSIQLSAPPRTRMIFQLIWTGKEQVGVVQNLRGSGIPIAFRGFIPTDVRIRSQSDIGCPNSDASIPQPVITVATIPTQQIKSIGANVCTGQIQRQKVAEWATIGEVSTPRIVENHLNQNFYGLKAGSWDFTDKDRIPAGVLVATDFGGRGETTIWRSYPLRPVVSYRSYGLFETTADFVVPTGVTGQCLTITP